ncbi:hypothetical protein chiPu_0027174, partial [Chiloscyllium punctatum]|nr:hypothetical protein [Chiloscyllium punctatum]
YLNAYLFHLVYKVNVVVNRQQVPVRDSVSDACEETLEPCRRRKERKRTNLRRRR